SLSAPTRSPFFAYTTLFRSADARMDLADDATAIEIACVELAGGHCAPVIALASPRPGDLRAVGKMFARLRAFADAVVKPIEGQIDRKSTRLNSSHVKISYAV